MSYKFIFIFGFLVNNHSSVYSIDVETSLDPEVVNQNQIFLNRKERFIKFDTKDNELEIELGISIPFIKVPLTTSKEVSRGKSENEISINGPGLVVAGMLVLTSVVIIPLLFSTASDSGFGFQRKQKRDVQSTMEDLNKLFIKSGIDYSSCVEKSICWIAKASKDGKKGNSLEKWIDYLLKTRWLNRLIGGTSFGKALESAEEDVSCEIKYSKCSLTKKDLQSFLKTTSATNG